MQKRLLFEGKVVTSQPLEINEIRDRTPDFYVKFGSILTKF